MAHLNYNDEKTKCKKNIPLIGQVCKISLIRLTSSNTSFAISILTLSFRAIHIFFLKEVEILFNYVATVSRLSLKLSCTNFH